MLQRFSDVLLGSVPIEYRGKTSLPLLIRSINLTEMNQFLLKRQIADSIDPQSTLIFGRDY